MTSRRGIRSALFRPLDMRIGIVFTNANVPIVPLRVWSYGGQTGGGRKNCMCESNVLQRKVQTIRRFHSFSSLHYDKAVIARMTSVDKTSTHASNEGVKLAARFVLVRFHASPGIIILKLCWGGPIMYAWEFNGTISGFVFNRVTYLSFQSSVLSDVSFCTALSPGGYSWCETGIIATFANGTHTGH